MKPVLFFILIATSAMAYTANLDCAESSTHSEKLVCTSPDIVSIDEQLNKRLNIILAKSQEASFLADWQKDWKLELEKRCKTPACLKEQYLARLDLLQQIETDGERMKWSGTYAIYEEDSLYDLPSNAELTVIALSGQRLWIKGFAYWRYLTGTHPAAEDANIGGIDAIVSVHGKRAHFEGDCRGTIELKADLTIEIRKEQGCGGLNVSFNGEYTKVTPR
jgi:uncharacterized protein